MRIVPKSSDSGTAGMTETMMPQRGGGGQGSVRGDMVGGCCCRYGVEVARTIAVKNHVSGPDILNRKPKASNSMEQELSRAN
jgi:hypothetical protein